jgi:hypothetical protein
MFPFLLYKKPFSPTIVKTHTKFAKTYYSDKPELRRPSKKQRKKDVIARSFIGDPAKANGLCGERKSQVTVGIFRFAGNIKL